MSEKQSFWHQKVDRRKFIIGAAATTVLVATGADRLLGKAENKKNTKKVPEKIEVKKQLSPEEKEKKEFREKLVRMSKSMVETQEDIILRQENYADIAMVHKKINDNYIEKIKKYAEKYDIDWKMLRALIYVESRGDKDAVSEAGAKGLCQFMIPTAKECGLVIDDEIDEREDPEKSIEAACKFIKKYRIHFGSSDLSFATYHMGCGNMEGLIEMYMSPKKVDEIISDTVKKEGLTYSELFFNNHFSMKNPGTYNILFKQLENKSEVYYWKILGVVKLLDEMDEDPEIIKEKSDMLFDMDDKKFRKYVENKWHKHDREQIGKITNL